MSEAVSVIRAFKAENTNGLDEHLIQNKEYLFQYSELDAKGLALKEITYTPQGEVEHTLLYAYDELGRITDEKLIEADGEISEHRSMEYNPDGTLAIEWVHYNDGTSDQTSFEYNEHGLPLSRNLTDSEGWEAGSVRFEYEGKLLRKETELDGDGEEISLKEYAYDERGRVIEEKETTPDGTLRLVRVFDDDNKGMVTRRYNAKGQLIERITYLFDEAGRVLSSDEENASGKETTRIEYDSAGNSVVQETLSDSGEVVSKLERQYDSANRLSIASVFVEGRGQRMPQDYRIRFEYEAL